MQNNDSRRQFLRNSGVVMVAATVSHDHRILAAPADRPSPDHVLKFMLEGNQRFATGKSTHPRRTPSDFKPLASGQSPLACVIACADSRVTPEIFFDLGIGELFVVRVAGNYVDGAGAAVKGSVEYAVAELGVSLVMILGHTECGAVKAAIQHIRDNDVLPGAINDLVSTIRPAVLASEHQPGNKLENAIIANVKRGVDRLNDLQPIIRPAIQSGKIKIVGGVYELATGKVQML
ncbi:carbonic anhydrase [Edaphobacter albus]|uniref:carbonic anhydrase n=1 Tax=Edaphobacter sp. 4G125 TaxID=2763071 RepID=UPI001649582A|nr:carbonic anhydrase [Edaphobacter sp. 4G125]QNI37259.1 carbonic anhydrase [Edaphobacter sp. 4G125]